MNFYEHVQEYCEKNNIELIVSDKDKVYCYSVRCNGFFDDAMPIDMTREHILGIKKYKKTNMSLPNKKVLAYSTGGKKEEDLLGLLAHEFGHATQYIESSPLWLSANDFLIWDKYFNDEDYKLSKVKRAWAKIVQVEADCEKRVLDFIDIFNLKIDKELYAQKANAYLYFYNFAFKKRLWYKTAPYEIKSIVSLMPKEVMEVDYYSDLDNVDILSKEEIFSECFA